MSMPRPSSSANSVTAGAIRSRSWPSTTTRCCGATLSNECNACARMLRPPSVCSTFGVSERMRVPAPAAKTRTAASPWVVMEPPAAPHPSAASVRLRADTPFKSVILRTLATKELRRQDSNLNYLNQNQRCCRLHHDGLIHLLSPETIVDAERPGITLIGVAAPEKEVRAPRARMTGTERRQQLIEIAKSLFAERGYDGTSIEEIAQRANVSKPVVYEHFGGKEGLYAVVVDREMSALLDGITSSLTMNRSRVRVERVALALLTYVEERTDGFRILIRDSPASISSGTYSSLLNDAVSQVSSILAGDFSRRGLDPDLAPLYAQALVGSVSMTAQWWLDAREPKKEVVAAHLVNLVWNGLTHLEADPVLHEE